MDSFSASSTRTNSQGLRAAKLAGGALVAAVVALSLMAIPSAPTTQLDASWQEMLLYAHQAGLRFGRDFIFTWGPWGFLCSLYHMGRSDAVLKILWMTLGQLVIGASLVALTTGMTWWRRALFFAALIGFHVFFLDTVFFVLIVLAGIRGLMRQDARLPGLAGWAVLLGFLTGLKFTYLALASVAVAAAAILWAFRGSRRHGVAILAAFAVSVAAFWMASGQSLDNLYPYVRRSLEVSSGYADAMGNDETWTTFFWGAALILLCMGTVVLAWRRIAERPFAGSACALLGFAFYVMWKESYVRADGHVFGLFTFALVVSAAAGESLLPGRRLQGFDLVFIGSLAGLLALAGPDVRKVPLGAWYRLKGNASVLPRLGRLPSQWQAEYAEAGRQVVLPRIRAAVGSGTVDVFDYQAGTALLAGFHLRSRPVFQSYTAYTPRLEGWNLRFYQSKEAPDFVLWDGGTIDSRYSGQEDAMVVAALPGHYKPVLAEGPFQLFRRESALAPGLPERRLLGNSSVHLYQEVAVPEVGRRHPLWLDAHPVLNALGRVRALLYKPPQITLVVTDEHNQQHSWRMVPRLAEYGFMLAPCIQDGADMASLLRGEQGLWIKSFHFQSPQVEDEFWSHIDYGLAELTGVNVGAPATP